MAGDSFVQKIILDGADAVNKQLKDLGEFGQQAFQKAQGAAGQAASSLNEFQGAVAGLFGGVKEMAQNFDASFGEVVADIGEAATAAAKFGAGFGGIVVSASAVSAAIGQMGQSASDNISKVNDLAEKAGLTLEKYQQFKAGAEGVGLGATDFAKAAESARDSIEKLQAALGKGIRVDVSAEEQKLSPLTDIEKKYDAMRRLGVAIKDDEGELRGSDDIIQDFLASLAKIDNAAQKSAIATAFFGKAVGEAMVSASQNLDKVNQNMDAVSASGVKFSSSQKETIDSARRTGVALGAVVGQWKDYVLALAAPVAVEQNNSMLKFFADNQTAIKSFLDDYVGPAIRWLGELKNALGAAAITAGLLGLAFGGIGPLTAAALGIAGGAFIFYWDDVKKYATAGITAVKGIIASNNLNSWDGWKNAALNAWDSIANYAASAYQRLKAYALDAFPSLAGVWNSVENAFSTAWNYILSQAKTGFPDLVAGWEKLQSAAAFTWDVVKTGASIAWAAIQKVMTVANEAAGVVNGMFGTNFTGATLLATVVFGYLAAKLIEVPGYIKAIVLVLSPFATGFAAVSGAVKGAAAAIDFILGKIQSLTDWLSDKMMAALHSLVGDELWNGMKNAAAATLDFIQSALEKVKSAAAAAWAAIKGGSGSSTAGGSSEPSTTDYSGLQRSWTPGHAAGGFIKGEGSSTSDSILARLSNGEFVVNAKAVKTFGSGFFGMLNNLQMPGYAMGGFVGAPSAMVPAFAGGGEVGGSSQRGDLVSFPMDLFGARVELFGSKDTVADLQRHSSDLQMSSALKRKPSWDR